MSDAPPKSACPVTQLRLIGLFGGLGDEPLTWLSETLDSSWFEAGGVVFHEGDPAREIFVVLTGELEVLKKSGSGYEARVAMLGVHDWFGEMSVLDVQPRSATVRALAPTRLLRIGAGDLDALYRRDLKAYSLVVLNIARELSRRLRVTDGILAGFIAQVHESLVARKGAHTGGLLPPPPYRRRRRSPSRLPGAARAKRLAAGHGPAGEQSAVHVRHKLN